MTTIKKQFVEIYSILESNTEKKVKTILPDLLKLMESRVQQKTYQRDEDGNITQIFCYYHKEWEDVNEVEYGAKKSNKSGLASMCKEGVSNWNKQQREMKQAKSKLLDDLASGDLLAEDLAEKMEEIEVAVKAIIPLGSES